MEKKLQKLTKSQMLNLLNRLYYFGVLVFPIMADEAFERGYKAAYENVKGDIVRIFEEFFENISNE